MKKSKKMLAAILVCTLVGLTTFMPVKACDEDVPPGDYGYTVIVPSDIKPGQPLDID
ncbi:MAG: hypothetical protein FWC32_07350 [Firmicutes bacterium]|nr:hypothetical protein [Bacillota bacterium]